MKLQKGKTYRTRDGRRMNPSPEANVHPDKYIYLLDEADFDFQWTYTIATGRLTVSEHENDNPLHIVAEWGHDSPGDDEVPTIDQVNFRQLQKGVAKIWDSYRI